MKDPIRTLLHEESSFEGAIDRPNRSLVPRHEIDPGAVYPIAQ
jgi:hypothetical protein